MKLISFGPRGYLKSRWNIFDGFIVIISIVDLILEVSDIGKGGGFSVLRTFRLVSSVTIVSIIEKGASAIRFKSARYQMC